ncbi:MAG: zinc-ribbon domain-containing protein [bacterium]|nr:zinc-ribbon domain-containing protein [bacterium]
MIIECQECKSRYLLDVSKVGPGKKRVRCSQCKHVFEVDPPGAAVLVAKACPQFCDTVSELLKGLPFHLLTAADGESALALIREHNPAVALLDVALPKIFGFQLCERLRSEPATRDMGLILIAAINDKTRYKRLPESLYGADDYLEIHHVADKLVPLLQRFVPHLFNDSLSPGSGPERRAVPPTCTEEDLPEELKANITRLARTILSDIALYNQRKIEEGIRDKNLEVVLAPELAEGIGMMKERFRKIPKHILEKYLKAESARLMSKNQHSTSA